MFSNRNLFCCKLEAVSEICNFLVRLLFNLDAATYINENITRRFSTNNRSSTQRVAGRHLWLSMRTLALAVTSSPTGSRCQNSTTAGMAAVAAASAAVAGPGLFQHFDIWSSDTWLAVVVGLITWLKTTVQACWPQTATPPMTTNKPMVNCSLDVTSGSGTDLGNEGPYPFQKVMLLKISQLSWFLGTL